MDPAFSRYNFHHLENQAIRRCGDELGLSDQRAIHFCLRNPTAATD